eukprot:SAG11_NODE_2521_length_3261_cov_1.530993_6_plen_69_part_00
MNDYGLMSLTPEELRPFPKPTPSSLSIPKSLEAEVLIAPFNDIGERTDRVPRKYPQNYYGRQTHSSHD